MKKIVIKNEDEILFQNSNITSNFVDRFRGLMGKNSLEENEALCISPCNSIHMFFMKFPIDVIFLDKNERIIHLIENMKPWAISKIVARAACVIEMPAGSLKKKDLKMNDIIKMTSKGV